MQPVIEAGYPAAGEPTFSSAKDAIAHATQPSPEPGSVGDWKSCIGKTIDRVAWCGCDLTFYLAGGQAIRLSCTDGSVNCSVEAQSPPAQCASDAESDEDHQLLTLNGTTIAWQRAKLARDRVGHVFQRLQPGRVTAYVYAADCKILLVAVLINSKSGEPFLYWEETT
jgi:hypothetical protein